MVVSTDRRQPFRGSQALLSRGFAQPTSVTVPIPLDPLGSTGLNPMCSGTDSAVQPFDQAAHSWSRPEFQTIKNWQKRAKNAKTKKIFGNA